jgi:hypothetical protein
MFYDVTRAVPLTDRRLELTFDDGSRGEIDLRAHITFAGVFAEIDREDQFRRVRVNGDTGTIEWPNGADLDPVVLYAAVTGRTVEDVLSNKTIR